MTTTQDFEIAKGDTFIKVIRWGVEPFVYSQITAITKAAPVRVTAPNHGLTDGWKAAVVSVKGMTQINAKNSPPSEDEYQPVVVVDENTVEFNRVNSSDFGAYTSGGYLQYFTPVDITNYTARLSVKDKVGGTVLVSLTTENGGIVLDASAKTITLMLTAAETELFTWKAGVYDLEMVAPGADPVVTKLYKGMFYVNSEVTT